MQTRHGDLQTILAVLKIPDIHQLAFNDDEKPKIHEDFKKNDLLWLNVRIKSDKDV